VLATVASFNFIAAVRSEPLEEASTLS
jgi:hypothetical protein